MAAWRRIAVVWAITGFTLLLGIALLRLGHRTLVAFDSPWSWQHWLVLALNVIFMGYSEGFRGFQQKFSPRFAQRVAILGEQGTPLQCVLAPAFAMGFFAAPRRVMITAWLLTLMIVCFVLVLRMVPQPWRGIADAGVVIGLSYGLVVSLWMTFKQLTVPASSTEAVSEPL